jgi:micrococcal nuclease
MGLFRLLSKLFASPRESHRYRPPAPEYRPTPKPKYGPAQAWVEPAPTQFAPLEPLRQVQEEAGQRILKGHCWVIDGDTIVINKTHIRLSGIDAPELDHPYGQNAKRALMQLCKGQIVTAITDGSTSHERVVATCHLEDGRDLSAEMVKAGFALDWAKHSGGRYRHLEVEGIRKKLWRADARQKGRMPPSVKKDQQPSQ